METFFQAIENHEETALYVALFIWLCIMSLPKNRE